MADFNPLDYYELNTKTTCTVDEAVAMMLGLFSRDISAFVEDIADDDVNLFGKPGVFSLKEELGTWREYYRMLAENSDEPDEYGVNLLVFDIEYMTKAREYLCMIEDELAKDDSELRCVKGTRNITLKSFDTWSSENIIPPKVKLNTEVKPKRKGASDKSIDVTFGILLGALAAFASIVLEKQAATNGDVKFEKGQQPFTNDNYMWLVEKTRDGFNLDNLETKNIAEYLHQILVEKLNLFTDESAPKQAADTIDDRLKVAKQEALQYLVKYFQG